MKKLNAKMFEDMFEDLEENPVVESAHKVALMSMGAVGMFQDEAGDLIEKMVKRGEKAEKESRRRVRNMVDRPKKQAEKANDKVNKEFEKFLNRLNIPTRSDITDLNYKITALTKKVDGLKKVQA